MKTITRIQIPGVKDPGLAQLDDGTEEFLRTTLVDAVLVGGTRAQGKDVSIKEVGENDVLEAHFDDGGIWIGTPDELEGAFGDDDTRGGPDEDGTFALPVAGSGGDGTRGRFRWALRRFFRREVYLPTESARWLAEEMESKLRPGPGLYHCPDGFADMNQNGPRIGASPTLLFIHGTASNSQSSFGGLTAEGAAAWGHLQETYSDNIYCFEHRTLSKSPVENVLELLELLPDRARLHLVTHSRGGIVGELLAQGASGRRFTEDEIKSFERIRRASHEELKHVSKSYDEEDLEADLRKELEDLRRLGELFEKKQPKIERFVRVACPVAGTTLASKRLDLYLNVILNLVGLIPALRASQVYGLLKSLLLAVVHQRTHPIVLPGLEAMMPGSPLVRLLNVSDDPAVTTDSDLSVIAGDSRLSVSIRSLAVIGTSLFFRRDNDFVVDTRSMYGGLPRSGGAAYFFDASPETDHFHYFIRRETQTAIIAALRGKAEESNGFMKIEDKKQESSLSMATQRSGAALPTVYLLPGMMGSELLIEGQRIWPSRTELLNGDFSRLEIENPDVKPGLPLGSVYANIVRYLGSDHNVIPFGYDWRRPLEEEAERLAEHITETLEKSDQPVRILGHSTGGILARVMMKKHPKVLDKLRARGGFRFVMLGTPNGGTHVVPRLFLGEQRIMKVLDVLDSHRQHKELTEILSGFVGIVQMAPSGTGEFNYTNSSAWKRILKGAPELREFVEPSKDALSAAKGLKSRLSEIEPEYTVYVAGNAPSTPVALIQSEDKENVYFQATSEGDGVTPWSSGIPESLREGRTWYMDARHGSMASDPRYFEAILELLKQGQTNRMDQEPKFSPGPEKFPMPPDETSSFPDQFSIESAAVEADLKSTESPGRKKVRVSVTHGDLCKARHPIAYGHHEGDDLGFTEGAIDRFMEGQLRERFVLGIYPGPIGTSKVFRSPCGAKCSIIFGLGPIGGLSVGDLTHSIANAATEFVSLNRSGPAASTEDPLGLTFLIVGTGFSGLTPRESLQSILSGVANANERIRMSKTKDLPEIEEIEVVELYRTRAIDAIRSLRDLMKEESFKDFTVEDGRLQTGVGGLEEIAGISRGGWWPQIKVESSPDGSLLFTALTERARAEEQTLFQQRELIDSLLESAAVHDAWDPDLANVLFQLLLPNSIKDYAADRRNIHLIVDASSAAIPWELVADRSSGSSPISIQAGLIRQLSTPDFQQNVETQPEDLALVIGDPISDWPKLGGAQIEARNVESLLDSNGFSVVSLVRKEKMKILSEFFRPGGYRLMHLAGHGDVSDSQGGIKGMVIGNNTFLSPAEFRQLEHTPEFVFVNCCHVGRVDEDAERFYQNLHQFGASLGTQLIGMGVRAVIVTGWAVNDAAALTFANTFYSEMLDGSNFGISVRRAREQTYRLHPGKNTWGAYQCYGDPHYRFTVSSDRQTSPSFEFVDREEPASAIRNLVARLEVENSQEAKDWTKDQLERILEMIPDAWRTDARIVESYARCYLSIGDLEAAVEALETLLRLEDSGFTFDAIDRLANKMDSSGFAMAICPDHALNGQAKAEGIRRIEAAARFLDTLANMAPTSTRLCSTGAAQKRLAVVKVKKLKQRRKHLDAAIDAYNRAAEIDGGTQRDVFRANINWMSLTAVRNWRTKARDGHTNGEFRQDVFDRRMQATLADASDLSRTRPSFFAAIQSAECDLAQALLEGAKGLQDATGRVSSAMASAWQQGGTELQRTAVLTQLRCLRMLLENPSESKGAAEKAARKEIEEMSKALVELDKLVDGALQ